MGASITICHWTESGSWNTIEVDPNALNGHEQHEMDIWPPVQGVTDGQNWPKGEDVYLNNCALAVTPSPTPSLPTSGIGDWLMMMVLVSAILMAIGTVLIHPD